MKSITYATFAVAIIGLIWIILSSKTKGPELHTYEVIYSGVNKDWQDGVITDTIRVPKVLSVMMAQCVAGYGTTEPEKADNWLLLQYEKTGQQPVENYPFFGMVFANDLVAYDNLVDSLISFTEIKQ
jgi:hypothetical protein